MGIRHSPTINIPTVSVPTVEIARIGRGDLRPVVRDQFRAALGDWGIFNWARNAIADGPGWVVGSFLNWLWDVMIQPQIDRVRDGINDGLRKMTGNTQAALNAYRDQIQSGVNAGLADARAEVQAAINAYRGYIQDSLNKGLLDARQKMQTAFTDFRERLQANFNETIFFSLAISFSVAFFSSSLIPHFSVLQNRSRKPMILIVWSVKRG